ncbi:hypothetical protein C8R44DRAFT_884944 [Mycena epipterygia]|nr:hypothetical protein C8R44DRAFT_884944 [Mycena epipterygia]
MSLVASRFHAWTKAIRFHTVVVRRHDNYDLTQRINDLLLPNTHFIRVLALDLRGPLSDAELSHIRRLLDASKYVKHLAVGWNIWAHFALDCGALYLESIYLMWEGAYDVLPPSLQHLQHPAALRDLTVYAPPDLHNPTPFRAWGFLFLPATTHCANLTCVTYAADRTPIPTVGSLCEDLPGIKGAMFVLVGIPEEYANAEYEDELVKEDKEVYPKFCTAYLRLSGQVLGEWVKKVEGRVSVLEHPLARALDDGE